MTLEIPRIFTISYALRSSREFLTWTFLKLRRRRRTAGAKRTSQSIPLACAVLLSAGWEASAHADVASAIWPAATPESQDMDSKELIKIFDLVERERIPVHSLLIIRNGRTVLDVHFFPYDGQGSHDVASVTKSNNS